jgi:hypothetical protein
MRTCRVPAVIMAAVIGGIGLTACAGSSGSSTNAASTVAPTSASAAQSTAAGASPTSAMTSAPAPLPTATATHQNSAAANPTTASAHPTSSPHQTASAHASSTSSGTHNFTVPAIPGDDVVSGYGSYTLIGTARVQVTMCAKQTGTAFSVGDEALAYNAEGATQNLGATILTGPGQSSCVSNTFILYTAHLKVHAFIGGSNGVIAKTGPVLTLY